MSLWGALRKCFFLQTHYPQKNPLNSNDLSNNGIHIAYKVIQ